MNIEQEEMSNIPESLTKSDILRMNAFMHGGVYQQEVENNVQLQQQGQEQEQEQGQEQEQEQKNLNISFDPNLSNTQMDNSFGLLNERSDQFNSFNSFNSQQNTSVSFSQEEDRNILLKRNRIKQRTRREKIKNILMENLNMKKQQEELVGILKQLQSQLKMERELRISQEQELTKYRELLKQLLLKGVNINPEDY
ncbi:hypothetical protein M0812_12451 [Anaeramoeba flamelloides]|uniref:BZIP domain-containing protein n=1 Tax=Anaeramoeba flamelloides TaxID=1746091 RepID=A0AAV7ZPH4_9EUKA|nr:hypothetical protein M0812_12451 [Anaeramoeba flamelloides]|eukprot:Anaeramoba_flamelloidesc34108_g2_i1.p1 GENE.c34108_g2_i1~~c34108_g2_i1.p1  ORF type:complete len:196 (-),score=47.59 c34108_g2_i1:69-656(-)